MSLQMEKQLPGGPAWLPPLDLEKWYQEVMAGFETSSSPLSPCSSPPPLPAKAHSSQKSLQVMPCSPRSPLGQRLEPWGKAAVPGESPGQGGLKIGCWSPRQRRVPCPPAPLGRADPWCAVLGGQELALLWSEGNPRSPRPLWEFAAPLPHSQLTSAPPCPGLSCQTGGRQRRAPPSDEEQHPVILAAQHLRAGAQPLAQGRAAGGEPCPFLGGCCLAPALLQGHGAVLTLLSCPRAPRTPRATRAACHATWRPRCRTSRPSASWPCSRRVSSSGLRLPSQTPRAGLWLGSSLLAHRGRCLAEEGTRLCPFPTWPRAAGTARGCGSPVDGTARGSGEAAAGHGRLSYGLLLFPLSLPPFPQPLHLTACLQPTRSRQSPCSQAMHQVDTRVARTCLEWPPRRRHGWLLVPFCVDGEGARPARTPGC